ncbi:Cof-type HAD-IIB family hydrolase [Lacrimispora sp. JR3]|uniref:Cof-type HAD-IIB family hydrolase n=1 Tax=Lacrimispora sinapis TaxID=3111456 RepID=UPI003748A0F9
MVDKKIIGLLCLDIDGTLLDSRKELPPENVEAVHYALEKGVTVAIASGRSVEGIEPLFSQLGIGRNAVCLNGGLILSEGIVQKTIMEEEMVMKIISQAERFDSQIFLSTAEWNITNREMTGQVKELVENGSLRSDYLYCQDFNELRTQAHRYRDEIIKIAIKEIDEANFGLLKQSLIEMDLFHVAKSDTFFVDITPKGEHKGKGVAALARHLAIPMEQVMCIGDNENDLEMITLAGVGVAMGNAVEQVKNAAVYVTADHDHAGVAEAIYRFI